MPVGPLICSTYNTRKLEFKNWQKFDTVNRI